MLVPPQPPVLVHHDPDLTAEHFVGCVGNAVAFYINNITRRQAKEAKAQDFAEGQYARLVI